MAIIFSLSGSALSPQSSPASILRPSAPPRRFMCWLGAKTTDRVCPRFILWASLVNWAELTPTAHVTLSRGSDPAARSRSDGSHDLLGGR